MNQVFEVENSIVKINLNCLKVPELKAVFESYEDPIPAFSFLHFMTDYKSPYNNLSDIEKEMSIINDYPGDYTTEDEVIRVALSKLKYLNETPTSKLLIASKVGLATLTQYIGTAQISEGRDGNISAFTAALKSIAKINQEFKDLERQADEEIKVKARGNQGWSYDEEFE